MSPKTTVILQAHNYAFYHFGSVNATPVSFFFFFLMYLRHGNFRVLIMSHLHRRNVCI